MEEFQKRMVEELQELKDRITKLDAFVHNNPKYEELDKQERILQAMQLGAMTQYASVLTARLGAMNLL